MHPQFTASEHVLHSVHDVHIAFPPIFVAGISSFALLILCCFYHVSRLHLHEAHARCRFFLLFRKEHIRLLVSHFSRLFHATSLYIKWILLPLYFIVVAWCNSCDAFVISIFISFRISWARPYTTIKVTHTVCNHTSYETIRIAYYLIQWLWNNVIERKKQVPMDFCASLSASAFSLKINALVSNYETENVKIGSFLGQVYGARLKVEQ